MYMDWAGMYCFVGGKDGTISVIEVEKIERERFSKQVAMMKGKPKIKSLSYNHNCKQILASDEEGNITF